MRQEEDKYRIVRLLGKGGAGAVYQVWDRRLKKMWAMKIALLQEDGQRSSAYRQIAAEIDLLKRLNHPLLPQVTDMVRTEDYIGMIMEYIEGITLAEYLEKKIMTQDEAVRLGIALAEVLAYLHGQRPPVIYGDLKPSNIMIMTDGRPKLIDFGTAAVFRMGEKAEDICGTYGYAAPEQLREIERSWDVRNDIYGLGATLYHMVTGQNPSRPPFAMQPVRNINPALSEGLEQIICRCTRSRPQDRYQTCEACIADLRRYRTLARNRVWRRKGGYYLYYLLLLAALLSLPSFRPEAALGFLLSALAGRGILLFTGRKQQFILWQEENMLLTEKKNPGQLLS